MLSEILLGCSTGNNTLVALQMASNPAVDLEAALRGSYSELSNLIFRGPRSKPNVTVPMKTTVKVCKQLEVSMGIADTLLYGINTRPCCMGAVWG